MRKKLTKFLGITLLSLMSLSLFSCVKSENSNESTKDETVVPSVPTTQPSETVKPSEDGTDEPEEIIDGGYYPHSTFNKDRHLKVINLIDYNGGGSTDKNVPQLTAKDRNKFITVGCFQGLMNKKSVDYYIDYPIMKSNISTSKYWLDGITKEYNITTENYDFEDVISDYKQAYGSNAGYILYDDYQDLNIGEDHSRSITAACNMAAIREWIPVAKSIEEEVKALGLEMKLDVSDKTERWVFENYKDEFDNSIIIQQRPLEIVGQPMVPLRDYGCQNKFFTFFEPGRSQSDMKFREAVHKWAKPDTPMLGWGPGDEGGHISFATRYGQFPIPSDFSMNLSVFNADIFRTQKLTQKNKFKKITPEPGKHYVAFGRSDGDNISVWANEFPLSPADFGSKKKGNFPMTWSIQPSLVDIAPGMMNLIYKMAAPTDYFMAPVSGHGYMYPSTYPQDKRAGWLEKMDSYLERTDLSVVEILDHGRGVFLNKGIANEYSKAEHLEGGICLNGDRYAGGRGAVIWSDNGKPFIAPRETLWQEQREMVAARINSYHKDYTRIEGYSFVNLHPWTHSYEDVKWVVENLDENCVVITAEQMIDMIKTYVPKKDVTKLASTGNKLEIPVDPLHNKFLLEKEDWTGDVSLAQNGLKITGQAVKSYKLPNKDDLVLELKYKGINNTSFSINAEINGKNVVIAEQINVTNKDGYNAFFIPFETYFGSSYKNKDCKLTIKVNSGGQIIIDDVITMERTPIDPLSDGDLLNDKFNKTTEDWVFSNYEKNAFVKISGQMLKIDGSDGWTGFFNRDVNNALYKRFIVPTGKKVQFSMSFSGSSTGTDVKIQIVCDGKVHDLTNGFTYVDLRHKNEINYLFENLAGKEAYIIIQQRDSNRNTGIGEIAFVDDISIKSLSINPSDNEFNENMDEWDIDAGNVSYIPGAIKFTGNASILKSYIFNNLKAYEMYKVLLTFKNYEPDSRVKFQILNGEEVLFTSKLQEITDITEIELPALDASLYTKNLTIKLFVEGNGTVELDRFKVEMFSTLDPYNNTFKQGMEDWRQTYVFGDHINKVIRDANWERLQFVYKNKGNQMGIAQAAKTYTLPASRNTSLVFDLEGNVAFDTGRGHCKLELDIDGTKYVLFDEELPKGRVTKTINLNEVEALAKIAYEGKKVTLFMTITQQRNEVRDGWLWGLKTMENK